MKEVYLDYSATTPVKKEVLDTMIPYFSKFYGNPSSLYSLSEHTKDALLKARHQVGALIGSTPEEIYFTGSGTESDNWALLGVADALKAKGNHIITTAIEHHAIIHTTQYLAQHGYEITYLNVQPDGRVNPQDLEAAITDKTILISVMMVNNEVGTVEPIKELAEIAKRHHVLFHTDAVQALGNVKIDVKEMGVDLLSLSAHKIYGPKGVGALYMRKGLKISNLMQGGAQEKKKRPGTENVPGIVGFGKAAELSREQFQEHVEKLQELRDYFISEVTSKIDYTHVNGSMEHRHPGNANITFEYIEGEAILLMLNAKGIYVSTGSACSSASLVPSHVLAAMCVPVELIHGTIRFTMGDFTTKEDLDYVVASLKDIVEKLRAVSSVSVKEGW